MNAVPDYIAELKKRSKDSKVYSEHQLVGLELAEILQDDSHKSLYMKLAKEYSKDKLLRLAKSIAERENVENKGAYFMKVLYSDEEDSKGKK
ncbi:MAG: hypothetical protein COT88_01580 [Candidatus Colwellbacteria bacterium CG10_big_fil_rev_8_21_14_0_10_41_28]|uniref:Uncharacterized protein n=1 Tax=Candidatus Colwellbacteria bacterium CG10_big_fil_rev_8_21_14_0_10_41_28 TaxID=1974539 RepID=A0A2H0VHA2_9BACT|nr:MAG: hypothetical protein COT88_01580 [Candidatus Colwellbacteria bacterium CG10_big_fil_rev_8_21_14_0_10_41_28]